MKDYMYVFILGVVVGIVLMTLVGCSTAQEVACSAPVVCPNGDPPTAELVIESDGKWSDVVVQYYCGTTPVNIRPDECPNVVQVDPDTGNP